MEDLITMTRVSVFGSSNRGGLPFEPARDMPSLAGKVILVTGGANGLGREAVLEFARHDAEKVYILDLPRPDHGQGLIEELYELVPNAIGKLRFVGVDLGSFDSVRRAVARFSDMEERLDVCLLNAGVMPVKPGTTNEGLELAFGINYVGHCLLSKLLMPLLTRTAELPATDVRLVFVSSEGHKMNPKGGIAFDKLKTNGQDMKYYHRYGQSKLAINLYMRELAAQHPQIKIVAVHPGRLNQTRLTDQLAKDTLLVWISQPLSPLVTVSPIVGVKNCLWATTAEGVVTGKYYEPVGVPDRESALCRDDGLARRLREWTKEVLGNDM